MSDGAETTLDPSGDLVQLATFKVGDEEYAIDIMRIKEIINPLRITPVPKAPAFIEGVVELRGAIFPIIDLRKRFDRPATALGRLGKYLIASIDGRVYGLVVDAVGEVLRITRGAIKPAPTFLDGEEAEYFDGVCHHKGRIIMILDLDRLLSQREKRVMEGLGGKS